MIHLVREVIPEPVQPIPVFDMRQSSERNGHTFHYLEEAECGNSVDRLLVATKNLNFDRLDGYDCFIKEWRGDGSLFHYECDLPPDEGIKIKLKGKKSKNHLVIHANHTGDVIPRYSMGVINFRKYSLIDCNQDGELVESVNDKIMRLEVKIRPGEVNIQKTPERHRRSKHKNVQGHR